MKAKKSDSWLSGVLLGTISSIAGLQTHSPRDISKIIEGTIEIVEEAGFNGEVIESLTESIPEPKCPECLKRVYRDELNVFGGM